ncbi:alpha/beta fold hydrolase [Streptacidiphilus fuscans]|uniref:alpha/beta fold hydrolase n=1 Tax=Streptacidiphilus fuscans TaxID=2789292 RepID=UPI001F4756CD|nr:alpha/beta fold hydrolase [Streptacidiphilus fuscans]
MQTALRPLPVAGGADLYVNPANFRAVLAWHTVPSWALVATGDKAIPPVLERFEAQRPHSHTVEVNSSHFAMVTNPTQVTDLIENAARSTAGH